MNTRIERNIEADNPPITITEHLYNRIAELEQKLARAEKIVKCTYQHEFKLLGNICMKCGWSQPSPLQ